MRRVSYLAIAGALALSACGGHGASPLPSTSAAPTQKQSAPVAFTMHWPSTGVTAGRRPHFVSPSTMSVVIEINNDPTLTAIANNPGGGSSNISLQAPIGSDDFIISLYDQAQTPGETTPVGNELGQVELVQAIKSGQTNTVSATVNGIAAEITMTALPNQGWLQSGGTSSQPQFNIVGENAAAFSVTALDAGGNAIVGAGIAPVVTLRASANTTNLLVTPVDGDSSRFTVTPSAPATSGNSTLIAQATDALGDNISMNVPITETSELFVSYPGASGSKIAAYDTNGNQVALPAGAFAGLVNPAGMTYDDADGQLLVADSGLGEVLAFDSQGNPKAGFTPVALAGVSSVTVDTFRSRLVATSGDTGVVAYAKSGLATGDPNVTTPFSLTTAAGIHYFPPAGWYGDELLIGNTSAQELDVYQWTGQPTWGWPPTYTMSPAGAPGSITDDGQAAYVSGTSSGSGMLWEIPVSGGTYASVADAGAPAGMAFDPLTHLIFVAENGANQIAAYKPGLTPDNTHTFPTPASSGLTSPQGMAIAY